MVKVDNNKDGSTKFYRRCYNIAAWVFFFIFRFKIIGRENINEGASMVCVNHSNVLDPIFVGIALGKYDQPLYVAKKELFDVPILSWLIIGLGAEPVDRDKADISIVKASLNSLKKGKKVIIFPEGTRVAIGERGVAIPGAIKIAERANVPILPVFLSQKKSFFSRVTVVFGESYKIEKQSEKRSHEDYEKLSNDLLETIYNLGIRFDLF